jgi:hypothetical protein
VLTDCYSRPNANQPRPLQQQADVGDGVGVVEADVEPVQGVGRIPSRKCPPGRETGLLSQTPFSQVRGAFLILGPAPHAGLPVVRSMHWVVLRLEGVVATKTHNTTETTDASGGGGPS